MDDKEIIRRATAIVTETRAGLLATVGLDGAPDLRWMATHTLMGSLGTLYTITAPSSNKVQEIAKNPLVTWLFTRVNYNEIVKLHGTALLEDEPLLKSQIWDTVGRKTSR
jgi:general stress protein 26